MVAKIEIHKYGSNKLRRTQNHIPRLDLSKNRVEEPIIKGKNYKPRDKKADHGKDLSIEREKGKAKRESTKLEASYDD